MKRIELLRKTGICITAFALSAALSAANPMMMTAYASDSTQAAATEEPQQPSEPEPEPEPEPKPDYESMPYIDLVALARDRGIQLKGRPKKAQLIEALSEE